MTALFHRPERAATARRIGALSIVGIVLVPLVAAAILVWSLWDPQQRLDQVSAAIVNSDDPVTVDGQLVPLGRQLAAGLVAGGNSGAADGSKPADRTSDTTSDDEAIDGNYNWLISDKSDAEAGLADGRYAAVVTIPKGFSAAATSFGGKPADARSATIDISTSDRSKLVDDAISQTISDTAARVLGTTLTTTYLDNVYVGFNTLGSSLGEAADGATTLADGADGLAEGARTLADNGGQLASGATEAASGATQLSTGVDQLATGASGLADGAGQLAGGVDGLSSGLGQLKDQTAGLPGQVSQLNDGAQQLAAGVGVLASGIEDGQKKAVAGMTQALQGVAAACASGDQTLCDRTTQGAIAALSAGGDAGPDLSELVDGVNNLAGGTQALSDGMPALAGGIAQASDGAAQLNSGASALSSGATQLSSGVGELKTGAAGLATGIGTLAEGVGKYVEGTEGVADGSEKLAEGTTTLADGLHTAVKELPSYSKSERSTLADAVANPVTVDGGSGGTFLGASGAPFYAVLALWAGALATFIVLRAVPRTALGSTRSSVAIAARGGLLPAIIGALQGVLVAGALQPLLDLSVGDWFAFAGVAALAGIAFASVSQALMTVFGGIGRFLSLIILLVTLGAGIISTAPAALDMVQSFLPVGPAGDAFRAVATGTAVGGSITALVLWAVGGFLVSTLWIARGRVVSARALRAPVPA